ncbi:MAG: hypothetical protein ABI217_06550 [Chthoniobacterales bacterium]
MASKSRAPFHSKIYFPALTVSAILVSASCFAQTTFLAVDRTPYDRQMTRVSVVLNASTTPRPSLVSLVALNQWMFRLREMPYRFSKKWKTPSEMKSDKRGDCKGKAVALYETLQESGACNVRLVIGRHRADDLKTHAWVEWETRQGIFLLDPTLNWTATLADLQDKSTYIPLYAYENGHKYRAFNPALTTPLDSSSQQVASRE